jgi:hypothetical protein
MTGMILLPVSLGLAFILRFTAHRTGICTVAAVGEVMSTRHARMFLGFLKTVLWVLAVHALLVLWMPMQDPMSFTLQTQHPGLQYVLR